MRKKWQNPPKPHVFDILDLPVLCNGDKKSCTPFQDTHNVPRIPKRYHMWGYNYEIHINTAKILKPHVLDILDLPDLPDGNQKSWKSLPECCQGPKDSEKVSYVWEYNDTTPQHIQNSWKIYMTFSTFLIILMLIKHHGKRFLSTAKVPRIHERYYS